jgi:hypothetical protein
VPITAAFLRASVLESVREWVHAVMDGREMHAEQPLTISKGGSMESPVGQQEQDHYRGAGRVQNRILAIVAHTTRYAFKGQARLAADAGVSEATISRLVNGCSHPSYRLVYAVTRALEKAVGRPLSPDEIVSYGGSYPTPSVCLLVGCPGCLPDEAYDEDERLRPEFLGVGPGQWSLPSNPYSEIHSRPITANQPVTARQKEDR